MGTFVIPVDRHSTTMDPLHRPAFLQCLQVAPNRRRTNVESLGQLRHPGSTLPDHEIGHGVASFNRQPRMSVLIHDS